MSFPYCVDLAFGSEKPTADPYSHNSFGAGKGGNSDLPKTSEELHQLAQEGLAYFVMLNEDGTLDLSDEGRIPSTVIETLPGNLKGVVFEDPADESVAFCTYKVTTDPLVITLNSIPADAKGAYIILKQAVN
jgi:hypothetical protein